MGFRVPHGGRSLVPAGRRIDKLAPRRPTVGAEAGFTLIELLIAASMMLVVAAATMA